MVGSLQAVLQIRSIFSDPDPDTKLYSRQFYITRFELQGSFCGFGSGIFPDSDPGDPKRPDPTGSGSGSGSATLLAGLIKLI